MKYLEQLKPTIKRGVTLNSVREYLSLTIAACVMLACSGTAKAHVVYEKDMVVINSLACLKIKSETSHGRGAGYFKSEVWAYTASPSGAACKSLLKRARGSLQLKQTVYFKKYKNHSWKKCTSTRWKVNTSKTNHIKYAKNPHKLPCGKGYYYTKTQGRYRNSNWVEGSLNSGVHYLK